MVEHRHDMINDKMGKSSTTDRRGGWALTTGRNDPCPCGSGKKYKKCCIDKDPEHVKGQRRGLAELLDQALAMAERGQITQSIDTGEEIWQVIQQQNVTQVTAVPALRSKLRVWLSDYHDLLHNAMYTDRKMAGRCLNFIDDVLVRFKDWVSEEEASLRAARGDALFLMGHFVEGDEVFAALHHRYPNDPWPLIWWGDQYNPVFRWALPQPDKAVSLYQKARAMDEADDGIRRRWDDLMAWRSQNGIAP